MAEHYSTEWRNTMTRPHSQQKGQLRFRAAFLMVAASPFSPKAQVRFYFGLLKPFSRLRIVSHRAAMALYSLVSSGVSGSRSLTSSLPSGSSPEETALPLSTQLRFASARKMHSQRDFWNRNG